MGKLEGKTALVTGGSSGIGLATAQRFVAEGAYVFITGRRKPELDAAVKAIGKNVTAIQGDVAKLDELDRVFATIKSVKGHLDVLFANAGIAEFGVLPEVTEDLFDRTFDINVKGVLFTVQKALPVLRDGSAIVLNGSVVGSRGLANNSVYSATKAAVRSFARTFTTDLKGRRIRVNVVSPGPIDTDGLRGLVGAKDADQLANAFASALPMGRVGHASEIASAVTFLASDDASFITGAELFVDGGMNQV
ncbi:MAG: 3-oxoacyl-[acyl-carrier protein] reductase [Labilithrix sp.]|nr:3-oxoacyl-[acyl-carrier protein] reductase [Labilithrix sp.]